jgi:hypothetical protein
MPTRTFLLPTFAPYLLGAALFPAPLPVRFLSRAHSRELSA